MFRKLICALALVAFGTVPSAALALSFTDVVIEAEVGSGANQAMIVIDWETGVSPSHAWLFRWDGVASFATAYDAIVAAEAGDFAWSGGSFVTFMDYADADGDDHVTTAIGWLSFWNSLDGESWLTNDFGVEDQPLVDGGWAGANANLPEGTWPGDAPSVPVPEPATAGLVGLGLLALARWRARA